MYMKMQVQLHAATKAKLMRQILVQKERNLFRGQDLGEWWTFVSKTIPFLTEVLHSLGIERGGLFFYTIIFLAFGVLSVRIFPYCHLSQWEGYPALQLTAYGNNFSLQNSKPL